MKSLWTSLALDDLDSAIDWVSDYDLDAALQLDDRVEHLVSRLKQFPYSGRPGRVEGHGKPFWETIYWFIPSSQHR